MDTSDEVALLKERVRMLELGVTRSRTETRAMKEAFNLLILVLRVYDPKLGDTFTERLHVLRHDLRTRDKHELALALQYLCDELQRHYRLGTDKADQT